MVRDNDPLRCPRCKGGGWLHYVEVLGDRFGEEEWDCCNLCSGSGLISIQEANKVVLESG